jgi:simple sugar transport system substrate-binding protein
MFYIGGDERLGGRIAAEAVLETITPRRAACANQEVGNVSLEARCQGWSEIMSGAGAAVDKLPISGANPTESAEILRNYFKSHADAEALLTVGPQGAAPALQVLEEEGLTDKVVHASFDLSEEQLAAIKGGRIFSMISTQQYLIGWQAVLMQWQHTAHGFNLASDLLTGPYLITKENLSDVEDQVEQGFM